MKNKRIVIALGHNALGTTLPEQREAAIRTAEAVAEFVAQDYQVVITHSNGPQVGMIHTAMSEFCRIYPEYTATPMSVCSAMSQGYIGYDLQSALHSELVSRGIVKSVVTVLTQVTVDPYDEAFYKPTKIIGRVMSKEEAEADESAGAAIPSELTENPEQPDTPDAPDEPALPKRAYTGCIRVHAVTAEGARPVAGAAVTVVRVVSGEPELVALQTTGDSGETETMTVPAPPPSADQRHPASFLYDISVSADGYYREHSTDVPVFPGVTSVQTFVLIPLPAGGGTLSGGDLTYYNDMPQL